MYKQMLAVTPGRFEPPPFQSADEFASRNAFQEINTQHLDPRDTLVQRRSVEVSFENLYIRQLWHRRSRKMLEVLVQHATLLRSVVMPFFKIVKGSI
jgi:hypothetical protein